MLSIILNKDPKAVMATTMPLLTNKPTTTTEPMFKDKAVLPETPTALVTTMLFPMALIAMELVKEVLVLN